MLIKEHLPSIYYQVYWKCILATFYLFVSKLNLVCLKWWSTKEKCKTNNPHRPNIHLIWMSNWAFNDLRSNIIRCSTHGSLFLVNKLQFSSQSKISDFNFHIMAQKDIAQFQISMYDPIRMHILNCRYQLQHKESCFFNC